MKNIILNSVVHRLLILLLLLPISLSNAASQENDQGKSDAALVKKINAEVATLDNKIKINEFEHLKVAYFLGHSEGAPPELSFYFESKEGKFILRACIIPVGHETWSKHFHYYFDSEGKPIKYLEKVKGREDKPEPLAVIYDSKNKIIWKNIDKIRMSPSEITDLFNRLNKNIEVFSHY